MNLEKYLPIGTIVLLKEAESKIMITGYLPIDEEDDTLYDYSACSFPEGIIDDEETLVFNHEDIQKVFYLGYDDEETQEFMKLLKEEINNAYLEDHDAEDIELNNEEITVE